MRRIVPITRAGMCAAAVVAVASLWSPASGQEQRTGTGGASLQLVEDLVAGNRILANEDILDGLGHISVRHDQRPDRFLMSSDLRFLSPFLHPPFSCSSV